MQKYASNLRVLETLLAGKKVIVAISGGFDSAMVSYFTQKFAKEFVAILVRTSYTISREISRAQDICRQLQIPLEILSFNALKEPEILKNDPLRCYHCKKTILTKLLEIKTRRNFDLVVDGTHLSDLDAHRPGLDALEELSILSPLLKAKLDKSALLEISQEVGFPLQIFPSNSCLATRVPHNVPLDPELLHTIDQAEEQLLELVGSEHCNVRVRIQFNWKDDVYALVEGNAILASFVYHSDLNRKKIIKVLKNHGFVKVYWNLENRK